MDTFNVNNKLLKIKDKFILFKGFILMYSIIIIPTFAISCNFY